MQMDDRSIGSNSTTIVECQQNNSPFQRGPGPVSERVTIGSLPDDVLLDIFELFQLAIDEDESADNWSWEKLVHVSRRWRYLIFGSPKRLELYIFCTQKSPVRTLLDIWPPIPLAIEFVNDKDWSEWSESAEHISDNLFAALDRRDRVGYINITNSVNFLWERILTAMEEPFPALKHLQLILISEDGESNFPFPDTFLNGSAPCLEKLSLGGISFPSLPRLLSSTSNLTTLYIWDIPKSGYISPVTMARCLSALPKLETLAIYFKSRTPYPQRRNRPVPPSTRSVLPALTRLWFYGMSEYLEVFAARIDAPLLGNFDITFFHELDFDIPQIVRFFSRLDSFRPSSLTLDFIPTSYSASILFSPKDITSPENSQSWHILYDSFNFGWQLSSVAQICTQILPSCTGVESLMIIDFGPLSPRSITGMDSICLQFFHSFPAVKSLYIPTSLEPFIAPALLGFTNESATEVLPSLQILSITGSPSQSNNFSRQIIDSFIAERGRSDHPIVILRPSEQD